MFDQIDVNGGAREQTRCRRRKDQKEHGNTLTLRVGGPL